MPDNDLDRRLAVVEQTFGLRTRENAVATPNPNDVRATHVDNINWKALYKVLESEAQTTTRQFSMTSSFGATGGGQFN